MPGPASIACIVYHDVAWIEKNDNKIKREEEEDEEELSAFGCSSQKGREIRRRRGEGIRRRSAESSWLFKLYSLNALKLGKDKLG